MNPQQDNVVIKRAGAGTFTTQGKEFAEEFSSRKFNPAPEQPKKSVPKKELKKEKQQIKIIAILLFLLAALLFLALVSYTAQDQANAELTMHDIGALFRGDDAVRAKAETTQNWLGIVGAVVSDILYNQMIGFAAIGLPLLLALWGKHLFTSQKISDKLIKDTSVWILLAVFFSAAMGTLQHISWLNGIPREWSGALGQFLSSVLSNLIGVIGSLLVVIAGAVITLVLGTDFDIDTTIEKAKEKFEELKAQYEAKKQERIEKLHEEEEKSSMNMAAETERQEFTEEPARVIRRSAERNPHLIRNEFEEDEIIRNVKNTAGRSTMPPQPAMKKNIPPVEEAFIPEEFTPRTISIGEEKAPEKPVARAAAPRPEAKPVVDPKPVIEPRPVLDIEEVQSLEEDMEDELPLIYRTPEELNIRSMSAEIEEKPAKNFLDPDVFRREFGSDQPEDEIIEEEAVLAVEERMPVQDHKTLTVMVEETAPAAAVDKNSLAPEIQDEEIFYQPPTLSLLVEQDEQSHVDDAELEENARLLQQKLKTFKIEIENLTVTPGPVVTQYEFVPAAGIKVSQIENLSDDMALALKARGIRIIAPIPGRGTVGIEIPNHNPAMVRFSSIVKSQKFNSSEFRLPLALGKTISGEVFCTDLAKMPHLLIAGATGAGKSVGMNTIIASLIYKMHPRDLKFMIIDPKKVEMTQYAILRNHFLAVSPDIDEEIITNPQNAVIALNCVVAEMERRYDILAAVGQRNIVDYNQKVREGRYKDTPDMVHRPLPYIVVIVDELADLMMTAGKEVEEPITRLAQLARAIGIHLVIATQRPSVNVITGLIKANFPARISYQVASRIDSRTILDTGGAEQLLGNGDMLYSPGGAPKPVRIQNAFISTDEVEAICDHIGRQRGYSEVFTLPSISDKKDGGADGESFDGERDPLFEDAARIIVRHQQGSVSLLQRRLKVGYSRAARIVDELEAAGIVGPFEGSKARAVLLESEAELEAYL